MHSVKTAMSCKLLLTTTISSLAENSSYHSLEWQVFAYIWKMTDTSTQIFATFLEIFAYDLILYKIAVFLG